MIRMLSISRINLIRSKTTKIIITRIKYNDVINNIIANTINEDNQTDIANLVEANNKVR